MPTAQSPVRPAPARVTHAEISRAISRAFGAGAVHRDSLLAVARGTGARPEVLEVLNRLPSYRYHELRQVLDALPARFPG
jgi:hypothetical protein